MPKFAPRLGITIRVSGERDDIITDDGTVLDRSEMSKEERGRMRHVVRALFEQHSCMLRQDHMDALAR